ncbi:MAG: ABC transporter permease [Candidatus Thermoplasmatota archaeon]|jgi:ABC-2 type transport system permease protein|nr:ABC transporter permease [Candidatus Thermoplasmatota archaeon]
MSAETEHGVALPTPNVVAPPTSEFHRIGQMSQFTGLYSRELLRTFRNPWVLVITVVQPFMWLAFFGSSFANVPLAELEKLLHITISSYTQFLLPGVLSTSMLSVGMFGAMSTIQDKRFGYMKRILLTPTSKSTVFLAKALGSATRGLVQIPVMVVAALAFGVQLDGTPLMWAGFVLALIFLALGFSSLFLAVTASSTDWQTPGVISNFIMMPLMFASGALFPTANFPAWMATIANWNPVTYTALLGRGVVVSGTFDWLYLGYVAIFAGLLVLAGTLVGRKYMKVE